MVGLSVFLFGSILLILLMLALSTMPSYNGLNPLYAVYISMILIGVGLFVMSRPIAYELAKHRSFVDLPRALIAVVVIGLGLLAFTRSYFSTQYLSCPPDGICWAVLPLPVTSIILSEIGSILLHTSHKKRGRVDIQESLENNLLSKHIVGKG